MKILKFRGVSEYTEKFVYGYLTSNKGKSWIGDFAFNNYYHTKIKNNTEGQFTGEKDKNDVEIYQDDFLESELGNIFLVDFRKGSWVIVHEPTCGTELHGECKTDYLFDSINFYKLKVIGNIHENKELL